MAEKGKKIELGPVQKRILLLAKQGKTQGQIAAEIGASERKVKRNMGTVKNKLGLSEGATFAKTVEEAQQRGLI